MGSMGPNVVPYGADVVHLGPIWNHFKDLQKHCPDLRLPWPIALIALIIRAMGRGFVAP